MGLPIPVIGFLFNPALLTIAWAFGAVKFWAGYHKTSFEEDQKKRMALTALWPLLFVASQNYRQGFRRALKD
ncbi:hypothetical protein WJX72_012181 [[Myrmecia] bisecta]|uniref:Uncharacterized protein n=1 Tax=[Myrmecia] bisecta TaxID=41462 RepID=A0AAW1Q8U6_9CHLO